MKINFENIHKIKSLHVFVNAPLTVRFMLLIAIAISSGFVGCKKFIEIPPPNSQLVTASVFNNDATANSAITDIYTQMFKNRESNNMASDNGLLSDELTNYVSGTALNALYYRNALVGNSLAGNFGPWQSAYNYIYQANAVIAGLQQFSGTSATVKQQLMGEAYFIRAFWHFYLTNIYGPVPVALTTDYTITDKLSRTPRVQVLQQVIADLKIAQSLLNVNYVDGTDTSVTEERVTPNKAVATALLARAYMYLGDYDNHNQEDYQTAINAATSVITNSNYSLCQNLSGVNSVFLANSSEAIWQLYTPLPTNDNTVDGDAFILTSAPNGNSPSISPQLLSAFETADQRKINWIGSITEGTTTYYFPYKYKVSKFVNSSNPGTVTEYTMVLRLAEQYLIRAEAEARLNQLGAAAQDLDVIRNRAGLPNTTASSQSDLLAAILHERQVELFTEWGARWFDLNRTGNTNAVLGSPGNVCQFKGGSWKGDGSQELYPIPVQDIGRDPNLTQNPGY